MFIDYDFLNPRSINKSDHKRNLPSIRIIKSWPI
jgi:hypothetical protein